MEHNKKDVSKIVWSDIAKILLSKLPYGDILLYFLNLNDRLKKKQLEDFIELFIERLQELNISADNIEVKEDFLYSMDLVFQNVVKYLQKVCVDSWGTFCHLERAEALLRASSGIP